MVPMLAGILLAAGPAWAGASDGAPLTLEAALALLSPEGGALASARADVLRAEGYVLTAGLRDNPVLTYGREDLIPSGPGDQDIFFLRFPLEIAGEPGLRRDVAEALAGSARETLRWRTLRARARVRLLYRSWRAAFETARTVREFLAALSVAEAAVAARVDAGDVSSYDLLRLRTERARHEARAATFDADAVARRGELEVALGKPLPTGAFPADALPAPELPSAASEHRPDLRAAVLREDAATHAKRLAARAWVPELTLMLGLNHVHDVGRELFGYTVGLELELPLLDTGSRHRRRAELELTASALERAALESRADAEHRTATESYLVRRDLLARFRETLVESGKLPGIAAAAYGAGEMDVVGLLDAHRAVLEARLQEVELALAAAQAWDLLVLATGEEVLP